MKSKMNVVLSEGACPIDRAHEDDAGYDLRTPVRCSIFYGECKTIDTGVAVEIPKGYAGLVLPKSGLAQRNIVPTTGVVDCGYTGNIKVRLQNQGDMIHTFEPGDKIAQLVLVKIATPKVRLVDRLRKTARGANGFGSTGR